MMMNRIITCLDKVFPNPTCPLKYEKDYELLLAVMLSAQTTDERVNEVTKVLFKHNLKELSEMDVKIIEKIIKPVGTQKKKSIYIKRIAEILLKESSGKVPYDRKFIESLPGVGHKTCNVVFSELNFEPAFAVDTHVSRVSKRLGLTDINSDVSKIEDDLCHIFPKELWSKLHIQMVLLGRYICKAQKPLCNECPFKNKECKKDSISL